MVKTLNIRNIATGAETELWTDTGSVAGGSFNPATPGGSTSATHPSRTSSVAAGANVINLNLPTDRAFDIRGGDLLVRVRLSSITETGQFLVYASGDPANYNNRLEWELRTPGVNLGVDGEWMVVSLNLAAATTTGSPTLSAIRGIRIRTAQRAEIPITMGVDDIRITRAGGGFYPNGAVVFTEDDGWKSQMQVVRRGSSLGIPRALWIIAELVGTPGYCTLDDLYEAKYEHGALISAHSFTVAAHNNRFTSLTPSELDTELKSIQNWLMENGFQDGADHLCFPGGIYDNTVLSAARKIFPGSARTTYWKGYDTVPPIERHLVRGRGLGSDYSISSAFTAAEGARSGKGVMHFYGHDYIESGTLGAIQWKYSDSFALMDKVLELGVATPRYDELF